MMEEEGTILSPEKQLKIVKLQSYFNLLEEFQKYRRLKILRNLNYPISHWIDSILSFYDVMFSETIEEPYSKTYEDLFERLSEGDYHKDCNYEVLLKDTRNLMEFANHTGITKVSKHKDTTPPGGARYV